MRSFNWEKKDVLGPRFGWFWEKHQSAQNSPLIKSFSPLISWSLPPQCLGSIMSYKVWVFPPRTNLRSFVVFIFHSLLLAPRDGDAPSMERETNVYHPLIVLFRYNRAIRRRRSRGEGMVEAWRRIPLSLFLTEFLSSFMRKIMLMW